MISVSDIHPDEPIGETGVTPPFGSHIVLDIGDHRYAVLAHLKEGSAQVSKGERVQFGQRIATVGDSGKLAVATSPLSHPGRPKPRRSSPDRADRVPRRRPGEERTNHNSCIGGAQARRQHPPKRALTKPSDPVADHLTHRRIQGPRKDQLHG